MNVQIPDPASRACQRFFDDLTSLVSFTVYLAQVISRREGNEDGDSVNEERDVFARTLGAFGPVLLQMVFTRAVDAFLIYLSDLLGLVFRTRPETLRSGEQIRVEEVVQHESMGDLIDFLAARRAERLAYAGLRKAVTDLERDLSFPLFTDGDDLDHAVRIVEVRNLIVHNRAIINATYLRRVPDGGDVGQEIPVTGTYVFDSLRFLVEAVNSIDQRGIEKFELPSEAASALPDDVVSALTDREWILRLPEVVDPEQRVEGDV